MSRLNPSGSLHPGTKDKMLTTLSRRTKRVRDFLDLGSGRLSGTLQRRQRWAYISAAGLDNLGDNAMLGAAQELLKDSRLLPWRGHRLERPAAAIGLSGTAFFTGAILGGGTIINPYWADDVRLTLSQGLPTATLGSGVGSCGFEQAGTVDISDWSSLLRDFQRVGVRGPLSAERLRSVGISSVEVVGDLALAHTLRELPARATDPILALNLSLPKEGECHTNETSVLSEVQSVVLELVRAGWTVWPFAMTARDVPVLQRFLCGAGLPTTVDQPQTCTDLLNRIGACHLTLSLRLHGVVLSHCAGVPGVLLGYRDKCADYMASMGLDDWNLDLRSYRSGMLTDRVREILKRETLRQDIHQQALQWKATIERYAREVVESCAATEI